MRLIDADALKGQVLETIKVYKTNGQFDEPLKRFCNMLRQEVKAIDNAPTIDAVEVVRCKDCKHRRENECPMYHEEWSVTEDGDDWLNTNDYTKDNGFCDWGERREP